MEEVKGVSSWHLLDEDAIHRILRALDGLEYGSVQIVVHDSKITQIERTEKHRLPLKSQSVRDDAHKTRK